MRGFLFLLLLGCPPRQPVPVSGPVEETQASTPASLEQPVTIETLRQWLSHHDFAGCASVRSAKISVSQWAEVAERVEVPPWVPIRAAICVVELYGEEGLSAYLRWVAAPQWLGLSRVVVERIDILPEDAALSVAKAALNGPDEEYVMRRLKNSAHPAVQQLLSAAAY
jgi:hypothetical protein